MSARSDSSFSSASTAASVASTSGRMWGDAAVSPPVTSMTPMMAPLAGSCTGAAVQLHWCTARL
jgi:uncharacterized membrane protein